MDYCLFVYLVLFVGLWFLNSKVVIPRLVEPFVSKPYNAFEKCNPVLSSVNGVGFTLRGGFGRYDGATDSSVYYLFFSILIPLIPIKCYRATELDAGRQYRIYGHESWRFWEIVAVYLSTISGVGIIVCVLLIVLQLFD